MTGMKFGLSLMAATVIAVVILFPSPAEMTYGHLGMLMLALIVVAIMLGFPTAFTLMGLGMFFGWLAFDRDTEKILDLMVQRTYWVMSNDVLIAIPLFVFMGYIVERSNIIDKLFKSLALSLARVPASLAVATLVTCALFATATGIVGAVVTLMGLLAFPAMLRHGYEVRFSAGALTAGGCLGILIPPSILLIVYGATAGVSVVKLYAGAFLPGVMLTLLYVGYVMILAKIKPHLAPPVPEEELRIPPPPWAVTMMRAYNAPLLPALAKAFFSPARFKQARSAEGARPETGEVVAKFLSAVAPTAIFLLLAFISYRLWVPGSAGMPAPAPAAVEQPAAPAAAKAREPQPAGEAPQGAGEAREPEPPGSEPKDEAREPQELTGAADVPVQDTGSPREPEALGTDVESKAIAAHDFDWGLFFAGLAALAFTYCAWFYRRTDYKRVEIFQLLLTSFFPLALLILAVLGTIVFGLATPSEAAAVGSLGGVVLALAYRELTWGRLKESVFLTARTTAMVCWLFVGASVFSAAFALLGGQELLEKWVLSLDMTPTQFMILSQVIIFLLGWPLEWTEIIVIFMPIFLPLLGHFNIDPLFFGLLVALNLQTAFLSPPVAMAAFYLKGVAPPHVTLNQIFAGMMPFMGLQIVAIVILYVFPEIGLWLPNLLYR
ncbi:MAG: TRAP transporter large permease subunit [Betaproteobacteria bacterium]|nr:TRAP transporter large permease subunit [Betaproteobacteria bacterium]